MHSICDSILAEDKSIKLEIRQLDDNKVTMDQIENVEVQLSGISYTSILLYLNEIKAKDVDPATRVTNSVQDKPLWTSLKKKWTTCLPILINGGISQEF
jgi:hypothetical protein